MRTSSIAAKYAAEKKRRFDGSSSRVPSDARDPRDKVTGLIGAARSHYPKGRGYGPTTLKMSARIRRLARQVEEYDLGLSRTLDKAAEKLNNCAVERNYRCKLLICPRCRGRAARERRRVVEGIIKYAQGRFVAVRLSVATDNLKAAHKLFRDGFKRLRRNRLFAPVIGGEANIYPEPARTGQIRAYNFHAHMIVEVARDRSLSRKGITDWWTTYLARHSYVGSVNIKWINALWDQRYPWFSPPAFYATKRTLSEWLPYSDAELLKIVRFFSRRRTSTRFGSWWGRRKKTARP